MTSKTSYTNTAQGVIAFIGIIFILYVLKPLIMPLFLAAILGVMVFPIQRFFERRLRCNRLFATLCSITLIFSTTVVLFFIIANQLQMFMNNGSEYISKISEAYGAIIANIEEAFDIRHTGLGGEQFNIGELIQGNFDKVSTVLVESSSFFSDLILIPIYLFFFLYYRRFFRNFAYRLFHSYSKSYINKVINEVYHIQKNYLRGLLTVIAIVGVLNSIGLLILGIENAIFFGFFAAILLVIPYVGVIIGSLLPALVALATKDTYWYAFGVIAIFGFIQFVEGYFITPNITGANVSINSFIAILALIAFAMLWGISGMIVALPITAALKIIFDHSKRFAAIGFLIGQPEDRYLRSRALERLKRWKRNQSRQRLH
ncbi:MAG: AI-2E family transporter [Dokdonia sp.]|jgi:predicted PurR-regulated permease PerM